MWRHWGKYFFLILIKIAWENLEVARTLTEK